jgi:hypothetical protein
MVKYDDDAAKKAILQHLQRRREKPAYVGELACIIGRGLNDTQRLVCELRTEGKLRGNGVQKDAEVVVPV